MTEIILFALENCPNCQIIKRKLEAAGYEYEERDMSSAENITELRINGCFASEAPVLCVNNRYFEFCTCNAEGFFTEMFHVKDFHHELPDIDGRVEK